MISKKLWLILALVFLGSFAVLGSIGKDAYQLSPPMPSAVVVESTGEQLFTLEELQKGQAVWQSIGGQQTGSMWGHGAYLAPDWSADWLHREAVAMLDLTAMESFGKNFDQLSDTAKASVKQQVKAEMRKNTFDETTGTISVSAKRAKAIATTASHYKSLFSDTEELEALREQYAIKNGALKDEQSRDAMAKFFFWASWATTTERPGQDITYTNNWPAEELVGNQPTSDMLIWTMLSILALLGGIGALCWYYVSQISSAEPHSTPKTDPLAKVIATPSMKATFKYFAIVAALFVVQIILGAITAHYAVEGHDFYGIPLADILPYTVTRTWHVQLAVFWIATAWLGTGLFIGPAISGHEPKFQRFSVNFLFIAAVTIVVGSMFGEWAGVQQWFDLTTNFWFGHQGYEFIDMGRFWQAFLFVGLILWVIMVARSILPALLKPSEQRGLLIMLTLSVICIGGFYGAGLMWGQHTPMTIVEYWRWWVVHLWVEGFFEVFATTIIALLFAKLGLIRMKSATFAVVFSTIIFMFGGILGTAHHWYFAGLPINVVAFGAMFSALEVVPLVLIGFEAYENFVHSKQGGWLAKYRWPIMFFVAVAFWNLVGAGLLGFLINPPLTLYYAQGLNTTPTHGHAALFGVYGMLALGLMLFCLRIMCNPKAWDDKPLKWAFWLMNIGLVGMLVMSLLPIGLLQVAESVTNGLWSARSAEFLHQPIIETLVWLRVPGDILFGLGGLCIAWFMAKLWFKRNA